MALSLPKDSSVKALRLERLLKDFESRYSEQLEKEPYHGLREKISAIISVLNCCAFLRPIKVQHDRLSIEVDTYYSKTAPWYLFPWRISVTFGGSFPYIHIGWNEAAKKAKQNRLESEKLKDFIPKHNRADNIPVPDEFLANVKSVSKDLSGIPQAGVQKKLIHFFALLQEVEENRLKDNSQPIVLRSSTSSSHASFPSSTTIASTPVAEENQEEEKLIALEIRIKESSEKDLGLTPFQRAVYIFTLPIDADKKDKAAFIQKMKNDAWETPTEDECKQRIKAITKLLVKIHPDKCKSERAVQCTQSLLELKEQLKENEQTQEFQPFSTAFQSEMKSFSRRMDELEKEHQELKESMQKREEEQRQINAERDKKDAERDETLKMLMSLLPKTVSLDQASSHVVPLTQLSGGQGANSNHTVLTHYQSATLNETSQIVGNGINNSTSVQKPD